jgi:hypothetical protein
VRFGDGRQQRAIVTMPHLDVEVELTGSASEQSGGCRRDHVQRAQLVATGPGESGTESALGLFVDQHVGHVAGHSGRTTRESGGRGERFDAELIANERLQSEGEKTRATIGIVSETGHGESVRIWCAIFTYTVKNPHQNTGQDFLVEDFLAARSP